MLVAEKTNFNTFGQYGAISNPYVKHQSHTKKKAKSKTKALSKNAKMFATLPIIFIVGFVVIFRFSILTEMSNTIDKQKKYLSSLEKTNSQLKTEIVVDLKTVDDVAKNKLGMDRPYKYQIVYVNLNQNKDTGLSSDQKPKFNIVKKISKVVEYLY